MKSHVEAATTGLVSRACGEVRFPDTRQTFDRLRAETHRFHVDLPPCHLGPGRR